MVQILVAAEVVVAVSGVPSGDEEVQFFEFEGIGVEIVSPSLAETRIQRKASGPSSTNFF